MRVALAALFLACSCPAHTQDLGHGVTCADIRKLTSIERWYWRKRLGLTDEQVRFIRKTCGVK